MIDTRYESAHEANPVPSPPSKRHRPAPKASFENPNAATKAVEDDNAPTSATPVESSEEVTVDLTDETAASDSDDAKIEVAPAIDDEAVEITDPLVIPEPKSNDDVQPSATKKTVKRTKSTKSVDEEVSAVARSTNRSFTVPPHLFDLVNQEASKAGENTNVFYVTLQERYGDKLLESIEPQSIRRGRPQRRRQTEPMRILNMCMYDDENDELNRLSKESGFNNRSKTVTEILRFYEADLSSSPSSSKS